MTVTTPDITQTLIIPEGSRENHLHLYQPLIKRGVKGGGFSRLSARYKVVRDSPASHLVMYTISGKAFYKTGSRISPLDAGDLWISPAGVPQYYWTEELWTCLWFHLYDNTHWGDLRSKNAAVAKPKNLDSLIHAVQGLIKESISVFRDSETLTESYSEIIGVYLDRDIIPNGAPQEDMTRERLLALWEHVNDDLGRAWSISDLSELAAMSPAALHRATLHHHGKSPMELVTDLRIRQAKRLLHGTNYTLEQIAPLIGYSSPFSLSRVFRRIVGMSPREFRRCDS